MVFQPTHFGLILASALADDTTFCTIAAQRAAPGSVDGRSMNIRPQTMNRTHLGCIQGEFYAAAGFLAKSAETHQFEQNLPCCLFQKVARQQTGVVALSSHRHLRMSETAIIFCPKMPSWFAQLGQIGFGLE